MWLWALWLGVVTLLLAFGAVLIVGAPYLPTLKNTCNQALDLLDLRPGQTLLELGSGDGIMLKLAAERGMRVVGYELNPLLVIVSWLRTFRYRKLVKIHWGNFWRADLEQADAIYVFLLDRFMKDLDRKIKSRNTKKQLRLVSHAFQIPGKKVQKKVRGFGALYLQLNC